MGLSPVMTPSLTTPPELPSRAMAWQIAGGRNDALSIFARKLLKKQILQTIFLNKEVWGISMSTTLTPNLGKFRI